MFVLKFLKERSYLFRKLVCDVGFFWIMLGLVLFVFFNGLFFLDDCDFNFIGVLVGIMIF